MQLNQAIQPLQKSITVWLSYYEDRIYLQECPVCHEYNFKVRDDVRPPIVDCHLVQCEHCGFVTYNPQPKDLSKYYKDSVRPQSAEALKTKKVKAVNHEYLLFNKLEKLCAATTTELNFFDYGCSDGYLLSFFKNWCQQRGLKATTDGVELNKGHANWAMFMEDFNVTTDQDLDKIENNKYDVVSLYHVLEHLQNPKDIIRKLRKKLRASGWLYISLPTMDRMDYSFSYPLEMDQPGTDYFFKDEHINIFSDALFKTFIQNQGFDIIYFDNQIYGTTIIAQKVDTREIIDYNKQANQNKELLNNLSFACDIRRQIEVNKINPVQATLLAEEALEKYPNYKQLISICAHSRDPMDKEDYIRSMAEQTDIIEVWIEYALVLFAATFLDESKAILEKLYSKYGYHDQIVAHLAYIAYHQGNVKECVNWLKLLLKFNPYDDGRIATAAAIMCQL